MGFGRWIGVAALAGVVAGGGIVHCLEHERQCIHTTAATLGGADNRDGSVSSGSYPFNILAEDDPDGPANGGGGVGGGSGPSA